MASKKIGMPAALFDFIFEKSSDLLFVIDEALRVRESSASARELLSLPGGGRGFLFTDFLSTDDARAFAAAIDRAKADGAASDATVALRAPVDRALRARLSLICLPGGGGRTLVLARPIERPDPMRFGPLVARVLSGYVEPALVIDYGRLTIRDCNKAAEALFGARRDELAGEPLATLAQDGAFEPQMLREARLALRTAGVFQARVALRRADGLVLHCATTDIGLFDEAGNIVELLCIVHDRSESEAQEADIRRIADSILKSAQELASYTAGFESSHDAPRLSQFGLSGRQIEVARRIAGGATSRSAAADLSITEATVKSHLSAIFKKLGVKSRAELINLIHEKRLQFD
jgi:PAS domain S-box-containing protein